MNHLAEAEYRFACLVWDNEPLPSGQHRPPPALGSAEKQRTRRPADGL